MSRKWVILLALMLFLFAGCAASPKEESQPPVDGQAEEVEGIKGSDFVVDEDGNIYYSKRGDAGEMICRDAVGNETHVTEWGSQLIISDDWIYFHSIDDKIYKVRKDGSEKTLLRDEYTNCSLIKIGDWIYFNNRDFNWSISRIDVNGENLQKVIDHDYIRFVCYKDDWLYYIRDNEHYKTNKETKSASALYKMKADGSEATLISDYNAIDIFIEGDSIYCLLGNLDEYPIDIYRTDLNGGNLTQLHILPQDDGEPYTMAVNDGWIYYYSHTGSDLHRVRVDGTGDEMIFAGQVMDVCFSGDWMFCFDQETEHWYKLKPDGTEREQLYPDSMIVTVPAV